MPPYLAEVMETLKRLRPGQGKFLQAVEEVLASLEPLIDQHPVYQEERIIQRIIEPERQIAFRVTWLDDEGTVQVNRGYRIEYNSALGPYKGGLRFHPSVDGGTMKFLAFEQIFKNSLTGLPIGGGKGGSDFKPSGRSDGEIMRFCQSFMTELFRHIGPQTDVPAGDIGVGAREIGYLFGQYKRLTNRFEGALTGKSLLSGGSRGRTEATGYGVVYFAQEMLSARDESLEGRTCTVSGAGNVALHTMEKLYELGATPVACSDSEGTIHHPAGIDLELVRRLKGRARRPLSAYCDSHSDARHIAVDEYREGRHPIWSIPAEAAFPCATENELSREDARELLKNGCVCVSEGANMPSTREAVEAFIASGIAYGPGKAANAGGVAVSQLEMSQNAAMERWSAEKVDARLQEIMRDIHRMASVTAEEYGAPGNLVQGANIAGFRRVADAMIEQGVV